MKKYTIEVTYRLRTTVTAEDKEEAIIEALERADERVTRIEPTVTIISEIPRPRYLEPF